MAQTTTAQNACAARIYIDDDGGSLVNVSGSSTQATPNFSKDIGRAHTFDGDYAVKTECKRDATMQFAALWTTAQTESRHLLEEWYKAGGRRTVRIDMPNSSPGSRRYEGEALLGEYSFPIEAGNADPVVVTGQIEFDGEVTITTIVS